MTTLGDTKPTRLEDLKPAELYRSAIEDFALPVSDADKTKKAVLIAAFLEGGVSWEDYVAQHPEVKPVITSPNPTNAATLSVEAPVVVEPVVEETVVIHAAPQPTYNPQDKLLIKMDRENPLYETRGHKFTQKNPYALMSPKDADYVLKHEVGFRQAFPSEVEEFYETI